MNLLNVIADVGKGLISSHPLGALAISAVNGFLPADRQISKSNTGEDILDAIDTLTPSQQIQLAHIDLKVEEERGRTSRYEAMCKADAQETRAKIVNKAMSSLILLSVIFVLAVAYVYATKGAEDAFSYEMAAVYGTVTATFAYVIRAYFGDLRTETESRHSVESNQPVKPKGIAGLIRAFRDK